MNQVCITRITRPLGLAVGLGIGALGCVAQPVGSEATGTNEQAYDVVIPFAVGGIAPAAADVAFTEIYRGPLNINGGWTYNNPAGDLVRVTVTGCQLATLGILAQDSNLAFNLTPAPLALGPTALGVYVGLWRLPYATNLGRITVQGTTYGFGQSCYALVEQSNGGPPPPPPPPPPVQCNTLNEVTCLQSGVCQPVYYGGFPQVFAGCVQRPN